MMYGYDFTDGIGSANLWLIGICVVVLFILIAWGLISMFRAQVDLARRDRAEAVPAHDAQNGQPADNVDPTPCARAPLR